MAEVVPVKMRVLIGYAGVSLVVFLSWFPLLSEAAGQSFPSLLREIPDPTGHYAITWKMGSLTEEKPHQLFLKNLANGRKSKLFEFYRQIDVLWAPDGKYVAITDWTGSNVAQILIFLPGKKKIVDLAESLYRSLGQHPDISNSVHVHFEAVSWNGPRKLLFRVSGDLPDDGAGGSRGFEHHFEFELSGAVRELRSDEVR